MSVKLKSAIYPDQAQQTIDESGSLEFRPKISMAHVAWFAMFISILIWFMPSTQAQGNQLGNTGNVYRIFLVFFALGTSVLAIAKNSSNLSRRLSFPIILLGIYTIVAFASSMLVPVNSFYTMWKSMEMMIDLFIISALLCLKAPYENIMLAYKMIIVIFIALLGLWTLEALIMPSTVLLPSRGVIPFTMRGYIPLYNGNSLAFLCATLCYFAFCRFTNKQNKRFLLFALFAWSFTVLVLAQSRTSLVGLFFAILVFSYFNKNRKILIFLLALGVLGTLFASISAGVEAYLTRGQSEELMTSLSGRTHGWEAAIAAFFEKPVMGHGFAAAARTEILGTEGASTLHGAIFDVMVGTGLMGLIPWVVAIILVGLALMQVRKKIKSLPNQFILHHNEFIGLFALIMVRSLTSSGIAFHEHTFMLLLLIFGYTASLKELFSRHKV